MRNPWTWSFLAVAVTVVSTGCERSKPAPKTIVAEATSTVTVLEPGHAALRARFAEEGPRARLMMLLSPT